LTKRKGFVRRPLTAFPHQPYYTLLTNRGVLARILSLKKGFPYAASVVKREELSPAPVLYLFAGLVGGALGASLSMFFGLTLAGVVLAYSCGSIFAAMIAAWIVFSRREIARSRRTMP